MPTNPAHNPSRRQIRNRQNWPATLTIFAATGAVTALAICLLLYSSLRLPDHAPGLAAAVGMLLGGLVGLAQVLIKERFRRDKGQFSILDLILLTTAAAILATLWRQDLLTIIVLVSFALLAAIFLAISAIARYLAQKQPRSGAPHRT